MSFTQHTAELRIVSPDGVFFEGRMKAVIVPGVDGEIEFLPHHEEIILKIKIGKLRYQTPDDKWYTVAIGSGAAQFANNRCMIYADTAERPEDIDRKRAMEALERAREKIRQKKSFEEYRLSQMALARALNRLKITDQD